MTDLATALIRNFEGCRLSAYQDTRGVWTIGYGHTGADVMAGLRWTQEEADDQLLFDVLHARQRAEELDGFENCNEVRQAVIVAMCFQLGTLSDWPTFKAALARGDYNGAADAGLDSLWATQTPSRAQMEMAMMRSGTSDVEMA